ncbi:MAG TPA: rhodanese-like domain-containing protein [Terracidiphilus sp.]|jgi:phage shock protein E
MNWTFVLVILGVLLVFALFKRLGQVSVKAARAYLQQGAVVVDVRSNSEFQAGHLRDALHIPLNEIDTLVARRVKDKNKVLLLHCQSGMRSQAARKRLQKLGYTQAFNLGSYARATRIVGSH